jgi:hypothetical protein
VGDLVRVRVVAADGVDLDTELREIVAPGSGQLLEVPA